MSEKKVIEKTQVPVSKTDIIRDLKALNIQSGDQIMLHVSLSKIGWIIGAERALIEALMEVITEKGTLVMPAQTGNLSDPALWENPPVPANWVEKIKANMLPYDPDKSPVYSIGRVAEYFRTYPGVKRSMHPRSAFSGWGHGIEAILNPHEPGHAFDEKSPLHRMLDQSFKLLMIGTHYDTLTALHYAESQAYVQKAEKEVYYVEENGQTNMQTVLEYAYTTDAFNALGKAFEKTNHVQKGYVGYALTRVIEMSEIIPFAIDYFEAHST